MTRLEANRRILKKLTRFVEAHPDQRFNQLLQNLYIVIPSIGDQFYEESTQTLNRINFKLD